MSHLMRPAGRQAPSVYWRRRLAVLIMLAVLALVGFLLFRLLTGDGAQPDSSAGGTSGAAATTTAAGDATASGTPTATSGQTAPACDAAALQVTATADAGTYAAGVQPKLGLTIRNVGAAACSLDAGSAALELVVVSGSDRIWSSDDCQQDAKSNVTALEPGKELASSVTWPRQRSAPGCPQDLPEPKPGTYQLTGRVGDITSQPLAFTLE